MKFRNKVVLILLILVLGGVFLPVFDSVQITCPDLLILAFLSRNGQPIPQNQISSIRFVIDVNPSQNPVKIPGKAWRDANFLLEESDSEETVYAISAPFDISRKGFFFKTTTISPTFHSVYLRIAFTDGKVVSFSTPINNDRAPQPAIHLDLSEPK